MANIKLGPVPLRVDDYDGVLNVNAFMEFQTTSNVLRYYEVVAERKTGFINREEGEVVSNFCFGTDTAKQLKKFLEQLSYRAELEER